MPLKGFLLKEIKQESVVRPLIPVFKWLFPKFNEIQFAIVLVLLLTFPLDGQALILSLIDSIVNYYSHNGPAYRANAAGLLLVIYAVVAGLILYALLRKKVLPIPIKALFSFTFYALMAYCSYETVRAADGLIGQGDALWDILNDVLIDIFMCLAVLRLIVVSAAIYLKSDVLQQLVVVNYSDIQMKLWQFAVVAVLVIGILYGILWPRHASEKLIVLTYVYSYAGYRIINWFADYLTRSKQGSTTA